MTEPLVCSAVFVICWTLISGVENSSIRHAPYVPSESAVQLQNASCSDLYALCTRFSPENKESISWTLDVNSEQDSGAIGADQPIVTEKTSKVLEYQSLSTNWCSICH